MKSYQCNCQGKAMLLNVVFALVGFCAVLFLMKHFTTGPKGISTVSMASANTPPVLSEEPERSSPQKSNPVKATSRMLSQKAPHITHNHSETDSLVFHEVNAKVVKSASVAERGKANPVEEMPEYMAAVDNVVADQSVEKAVGHVTQQTSPKAQVESLLKLNDQLYQIWSQQD